MISVPARIQELVAGNALGDLEESERRELERYLETNVDSELMVAALQEDLEQTAAAIHLTMVSGTNELEVREELTSQLRIAAKEFFARPSNARALASDLERSLDRQIQVAQHSPAVATESSVSQHSHRTKDFRNWREAAAWLSTAAAVLCAFLLWNGRPTSVSAIASAMDLRSQLIESKSDLIQVDWNEGTTPFASPVGGDVVWSNSLQQGFMRFIDLPINDPLVEQYQLWIIDPERDDEPIDGGVFNVTQSGEVVVPIQAKLQVVSPEAFAITIEKPGGVVVSTQERLPLLASIN